MMNSARRSGMLHIGMPPTAALETIRIGELSVLRCAPIGATRAPVLFVHGYFADATVFNEWLSYFAARGFPAFAINLRGRAGSRTGVDLGRTSIDDFADDASEVARSLGKPFVVGHSMGGLIAQKLAERGDARAVALITPAPPRGITVLSPRLAMKQLKYLPSILRSRLVNPAREDLREIVANCVPEAVQDEFLDRLSPDSGRAGRDMSITGVAVDATRVRCPVLVVAAEFDRFIPSGIVRRIAERYGAPLETFPGHGHMIVVEPGWEKVAERVVAFLVEH
ncbi:MAG: alpha/beta fold hydrolase [Gemmatimonadaceae bacterium]